MLRLNGNARGRSTSPRLDSSSCAGFHARRIPIREGRARGAAGPAIRRRSALRRRQLHSSSAEPSHELVRATHLGARGYVPARDFAASSPREKHSLTPVSAPRFPRSTRCGRVSALVRATSNRIIFPASCFSEQSERMDSPVRSSPARRPTPLVESEVARVVSSARAASSTGMRLAHELSHELTARDFRTHLHRSALFDHGGKPS
jgi:hypothetical protein